MAIRHIPERFEWDDSGRVVFDGKDLAEMAEAYPTPFYLLSKGQIADNLARLRTGFAGAGDDLKIYYSIKSNYESLVLATLKEQGTGAELSGPLDFELAHRAGFTPDEMVYDSPWKAPEDLERAVSMGIHLIDVESLPEARKISEIAGRLGVTQKVGLRIDPLLPRPVYDRLITTYKKKFGLPFDQALAGATEIARMPNLELVGLMSHVGSQIFTPRRYLMALERHFRLAEDLAARGIAIEEINLGGGYPAESMRNVRLQRRFVFAQILEHFNRIDRDADRIEDFGAAICEKFHALKRATGISPALAIEPGRCLVANACVVVGKIHVVKNDWVFTDVSVNNLPEALFFSEWRLAFPGQPPSARGRKYNVSGPTLLTQDVLFFRREVPNAREGAPFAVLDAGAYSVSRANQFTRPRIACYGILEDGSVTTVRRAESVEDVLFPQVWPGSEEARPKPKRARKARASAEDTEAAAAARASGQH